MLGPDFAQAMQKEHTTEREMRLSSNLQGQRIDIGHCNSNVAIVQGILGVSYYNSVKGWC
jgi:hypothetical protein